MNNGLNRIICLHTFIKRVIHSIRVLCLGLLMFGLLRLVLSYFQSTIIESSCDESSTFCTLWHPSVLLPVSTTLPLATRLLVCRVISALRWLKSMRVYWTWMFFTACEQFSYRGVGFLMPNKTHQIESALVIVPNRMLALSLLFEIICMQSEINNIFLLFVAL